MKYFKLRLFYLNSIWFKDLSFKGVFISKNFLKYSFTFWGVEGNLFNVLFLKNFLIRTLPLRFRFTRPKEKTESVFKNAKKARKKLFFFAPFTMARSFYTILARLFFLLYFRNRLMRKGVNNLRIFELKNTKMHLYFSTQKLLFPDFSKFIRFVGGKDAKNFSFDAFAIDCVVSIMFFFETSFCARLFFSYVVR